MNPFTIKLFFIDIFIWLLPPIRQYKNKYFLYFSAVGLTDFIALFYMYYINRHNNHIVFLVLDSIYILALLYKKLNKRKLLYYFSFMTVLVLFRDLYTNMITDSVAICLVNIVVLYILFTQLFQEIARHSRIDFFIFMIILYEMSVLTKVATLMTGAVGNNYYFMATNIFDIFLAIFFIIFRYPSPKLIFQIKQSNNKNNL